MLNGKKAFVTGGSRGLGAAIVRELAKQGAAVCFSYLSNKDAADSLCREIASAGGKAHAVQADAGDFSRAGSAIADAESALQGLDALVCCAGIARSSGMLEMAEKDWDDVLRVNLKGTFGYVQSAGKIFASRQAGKIVCIGSINGLRGRMGTISYNVSKAGLTGLVKTAASELGRYNVNVNLVAPGFVESTTQKNTPEIIRDLVLKECAIKRLGTPGDIAPLVAFLCSSGADHITGQVIKADAGQYL